VFPTGHRRNRALLASTTVVVAALVTVLTSACSDSSQPQPSGGGTTTGATTTETAAAPGDALEEGLYFYPSVEGATLSYANSGMGAGTTEVTVDSVSSDAQGQTVNVTEVVSGDGTPPVTVERSFRTGADGSLVISADAFGAFGSSFTVTAVGDDILIPGIAELSAGNESSGETFVDMSGSGVEMHNEVTYTVSGVGAESVTVAAGTAEAYVVEIALEITSSLTGTTTPGTARYWFVPGFGLAKQEMNLLSMTLATELTASSVPLP